jgi:CubicO group peptidase (beta-lactamase class C family)
VLFKQAWGWMDKKRTLPMREDAVFDLASVTKAIGATTALALCIDRGWICPDSAFTNYLPEYKATLREPVTVRDLARHLSGFNNSKAYDQGGQVVERILQFSPVRAPGEPYEYACCNYILLGLIAERASGKRIDAFCDEQVFGPLGMRDTRWAPLPDPDPKRVVRQAVTGTLGVASDPPARHAGRPLGNAGLFSTAPDLSAFCRMVLAGGMCGD